MSSVTVTKTASSQTTPAIRHTFATKRQPPLTIDTLLNSTVDASHNAVLENGHCPPQFRTHGYVYAIDNGPGRRKIVLQSLVTERRIEAVEMLVEKNDMSIVQNYHVEIVGILKAAPNAVFSSSFEVADGDDGASSSSVKRNEEDSESVLPSGPPRKPYIWIYQMHRITDPRAGDLFLLESMLSARMMEVDGLGIARARPASAERYHQQHPPAVRFLNHVIGLSSARYKRMLLPVVVGDCNVSDRMISASTPFSEPASSASGMYLLNYVRLMEALRIRKPDTMYNADTVVTVKNEFAPMPVSGETCILIGKMEDATTFCADMLVRYPGQPAMVLMTLIETRGRGALADEKNFTIIC